MNPAQELSLIGNALAQAESFIAGQPVTITIPDQTFDVEGIKVIGGAVLTFKKG